MTTIFLAVQCGPDYDVSISAHATRELAEAEVCDWLGDYGDDCAEEITEGRRAIMSGETAYMNDGEHWYEVRAVAFEGAPLAGQTGRDTQPAREAIANADAHLNDAGLQTYSELCAALAGAIEGAGFSIPGPTDTRAAEHGEPAWICNARAALADAHATAQQQTQDPRDLIGGLIEYAEQYAEQNSEPDDGDCRETIAAARTMLEAGFTVA